MTDDADADDMLDVFTGVEGEESITSILCRGLSDVNIHSLLEQTKQVAEEIERGR